MTQTHPAHVFLETTIECNLRCVQCDIYKLSNPEGELSVDERRGVVRQVAAWHPSIRIVFGGGEPFYRRRMLYDVAETCRERDVYTTLNTNGTLILDSDVERLPFSGVRCVVLSVDSDEPEVHDRIRGVRGTYARAISSIRRLVAARDRARRDFTVLTSTILGKHNLDRVDPMVSLFEELGVDTTLFQPIQPVFARPVSPQWWIDNPLFPDSPQLAQRGIERLIALKSQGRRLFQTPSQFEDMRDYFHNPHRLPLGRCSAMDRHMMVDMMGDVRLCFNMERIGLKPVGNVRRQGLREIWEGG
jgi:MoaA/NifB/PqqE/SkfB family radical SAM enzyme